MTFERNPDLKIYEKVTKAVEKNKGYCPCMIFKTEQTKCPCEEFKTQVPVGKLCRCGRFVKVSD